MVSMSFDSSRVNFKQVINFKTSLINITINKIFFNKKVVRLYIL